jgi:hypothetical protein
MPTHIPRRHFGIFLLLCCWHIWKWRNNVVCRNQRTTLNGGWWLPNRRPTYGDLAYPQKTNSCGRMVFDLNKHNNVNYISYELSVNCL